MGKKVNVKYLKALFLVMILFFNVSCASAAQWEVGVGKTYDSIQLAIDNVKTIDGDVINVHSGVYCEDVTVNKKLTLQANPGDDVQLQPVNTGITVVDEGSGSTIDGFNIDNSPQGTGINVTADECTVKNNQINGGITGIAVSGANTTIVNNVISGQSGTGILANLTGGFFTISGNSISNIIGLGTLNGITVSTNGSVSDINISQNTISHIQAMGTPGSVFAIQLGKSKGTDGNPEVANVTHLIVTGNIINDINASSAIMGMELVSNSVNALILNNNISHLQGSTNSSVYAVEAAIVGNGTVMVSKNIISHIVAQQQAAGIVTVALGDLLLENNQVINISKANASVAILGLGLLNNATLKNNSVSNITSPQVAAGILGVALSNLNMEYNTANGVDGANDVSMVAAGFNTSKVTGNNLEGDGSGIGLVICSFNGTVNYNRIANYDYYIQNFLFSNFGPSIDEMLKPLDEAIKNHPELEPILKPIRDDLDKMFHQLENSTTTATYNWYGTNAPDPSKFFSGNGTLNYYPWLVLNVNANPSTINPGESSTITADVFHDVAGGDHSKDASLFFSGSRVIFTTNLGNVGSKSVTVPWTNGLARAILRADEGAGIATVTAADYQVVQTLINIQGASNSANAVSTTRTVGMKNTGQPLAGIVMSILLVLGGMISVRKNQ